jgi:hypothetical protein
MHPERLQINPPARDELPSKEEIADATISIQSFVFNIFGAIDNLAWIWVSETGQKRADGTPIPKKHIGLWPDNSSVRATLSSEFQEDFDGYDQLMAEQLKLGRFRPWIQQSFEENSVPIVFHPQMLSDFATIEELGTKMLEEFSKEL